MNKKSIFITGGCGFIGANLVEFLMNRYRDEATVYDNLSTGYKDNLEDALSNSRKMSEIRFIEGDILDVNKLNKAARGCEAIVHLAAHTDVVNSLKNPENDFNTNVIGTYNVLELARKEGIKRVVFASSNAVIGEQIPPIDETKIASPISPYGAGKLAGEALCSAYYRSFGIETVILRFANCYGPYSTHKTSVISKFIKKAQEGDFLEIFGDGKQTRDFVNSKDIAAAIDLALNAEKGLFGSPIQIACGIETKILDLANMLKKLLVKYSIKEPEIKFMSERKGEIKRNYADISKAKRVLGYNPTVELNKGLDELIAFFTRKKKGVGIR